MKFYDRVLTNAATISGTGSATWTAARAQHALPPAAINEEVVYTILDLDGAAWETGRATLSEATGTYTLTRGGAQTVTASSNAGSAVTLSTSAKHTLFLTPDARVVSGMRRRLSQQVADNTTGTYVIELPTGYEDLTLRIDNLMIAGAVEAFFNMTVSVDGGATYLNSGYAWSSSRSRSDYISTDGSTAATAFNLGMTAHFAPGETSGMLINVGINTSTHFGFEGPYVRPADDINRLYTGTHAGVHRATGGLVTHLQLDTSIAANIETGVFTLYGTSV